MRFDSSVGGGRATTFSARRKVRGSRNSPNSVPKALFDFPPWWQVPTGLSATLASFMHLVDALARMQLTASGQPASSMPIVYQGKKMTLLKGDAALMS